MSADEPGPASSPPAAPGASTEPPVLAIPPLSRRMVLGGLRFIPVFLLLVVVPYVALTRLAALGVTSSFDLATIVAVGTLLAAIGSVRYVARPTRLFGPVGAFGGGIAAAYLWLLSHSARFSVAGPSQTTITLDYGPILVLFALVPLFGVIAALVTTAEDVTRPGERLRIDYGRS